VLRRLRGKDIDLSRVANSFRLQGRFDYVLTYKKVNNVEVRGSRYRSDLGTTYLSCQGVQGAQSSQDKTKNKVNTDLICQQRFLQPVFVLACGKDLCRPVRDASSEKKNDSVWNARHSWTEAIGWVSVTILFHDVSSPLCKFLT